MIGAVSNKNEYRNYPANEPVNFSPKALIISKIAIAVFMGTITTVGLLAAGVIAPIALIGGIAISAMVYKIASKVIGKKDPRPLDIPVPPPTNQVEGNFDEIPNTIPHSQIKDPQKIEKTEERIFPVLSKIQVEELNDRAFKDYITKQHTNISLEDQTAILNYWCTENKLDDIKELPASFDYLHCAQPISDAEYLIKKYFDYLGTRINEVSEIDCLAFLLSPFLASHPSTIFEEAILFFNLKALLQKEKDLESKEAAFKIEVLSQIARQIYPNPAEQEAFIKKILKPKDLDFRFFQELQEGVALFVGARFPHYITNLIIQNWTQVLNPQEASRWWFKDIISPQIETIMRSLNEESLPAKVERIKRQIIEIKTADERVRLLCRAFACNLHPVELTQKPPYFTEQLVDFNSDLSTVYQLFKGRGKDMVYRQALYLIQERVWKEYAPSYDYILKLLLIQWLEYNPKNEKAQECNLTIPFQIILYCHLQDKAQANNLDAQGQKLLHQIEDNANNWKKSDYLQNLLHQLNNKIKIDDDILYLVAKSQQQLTKEKRLSKDSEAKLKAINTLKEVLQGVNLESDKQEVINQINNYLNK